MSQSDSSSDDILPATPDDSQEPLSGMIPAVPQWQQLASMDQQSPNFLPLLSSLTAEVNRPSTTKLCGDDARITLSIMDEVSSACVTKAITYITSSIQVLRGGKVPDEYECDTLCTMRTLAYNSGQVPPRYEVDRQSLSTEAHVIAHGAFADVREGRLGDRTVAVRSLRTDRQTNLAEVQKVRTASNKFFRRY